MWAGLLSVSLASQWILLTASHGLPSIVCVGPHLPFMQGQWSYWITVHPNDLILT